MCGIVAYLGEAQAREVLISGLSRLEYRGYDSAGLAVMQEDTEAAPAADGRATKRHRTNSSSGQRISVIHVPMHRALLWEPLARGHLDHD